MMEIIALKVSSLNKIKTEMKYNEIITLLAKTVAHQIIFFKML